VSFRLAASNIAWEPSDDDAVARILLGAGFKGVEIAPTKRWESPIEATTRDIAAYKAEWSKRGLEIVALQSLLYGRPDLQLFGNQVGRRALREYMMALIDMAAGLGAKALVFGSPKNRQRKSMPMSEAAEIAGELFRELGALAVSRGCVICIEPNPPSYDCDFINTTAEAVTLVQAIASRGVKVQGDLGAILSMHEDPATAIASAGSFIGHFHVSEPMLAEIVSDDANAAAARALKKFNYGGWVSIEMRGPAKDSGVEAIQRAVAKVAGLYAGVGGKQDPEKEIVKVP
jgi:D-psicose/D-tagatose/L-ribulose 3-epimerase